MNTKKITDADVAGFKISSLPTRPTAPTSLGGRGYSSKEMKEAFDRLPLYIIEKFNLLVDDICEKGENSLSAAIPTGISDTHTLYDLFSDIVNGRFASYLSVGDGTLENLKEELFTELERYSSYLGTTVIDGASPSKRNVTTGEVAV